MKKLEEVVEICVWKVLSNDENSTTFKDVEEGHKLYNCLSCSGNYKNCSYGHSYEELKIKYNNK